MNDELKTSVLKIVKEYMKTSAFTDRKLTDMPTDSFQVVNRKYVNLNGTTSNRPTSSVVGQSYFDTSLASGKGQPIWYNGTGFVDANGNYV